MQILLVFDYTNFIGRFHPILVHLPIGFLILSIMMELYQRLFKKESVSHLISYGWLLGFIGSFLAAFCGWYLGESGLYIEDDLYFHRWLGVAVVILSVLGWFIKRKPDKYPRQIHYLVNIIVLGALLVEGHLGGGLTHGSEYLFEYAPQSIKNIMVKNEEEISLPSNIDSINVYNDLVRPIFDQKCYSCHDNKVQRGGLNMESIDSLVMGGSSGKVLIAKSFQESELFKRVILPQKSLKFMPPVGNPLSYDEIKILEWWITEGADFSAFLKDFKIDESLKPILLRLYGLDTNKKPYYETLNIPPLDSLRIINLEKWGFQINSIGGQNPLIELGYSRGALAKENAVNLEQASQNITWLSMPEVRFEEGVFSIFEKFTNLSKLNLYKSNIQDNDLQYLKNLKHLEVLNIYNTDISDSGLEYLNNINSLRRIYLWRTKITAKGITALKESNPQIEIITGNNN